MRELFGLEEEMRERELLGFEETTNSGVLLTVKKEEVFGFGSNPCHFSLDLVFSALTCENQRNGFAKRRLN